MKQRTLYNLLMALPTAALCSFALPTIAQVNTGVNCDNQYCSIEIHSSLSIQASVDNFYQETDGRYEMVGDLTVSTSAGIVDLLDANLIFEKNPEGSDIAFEVYGIAQAPFGSIPLLGNAGASAQPVAAVGLVSRNTLQALLATEENPLPLAENPKDPEGDLADIKQPAYLFFHFESGLSFDIPLNQLLKTDNENFGFAIPGDQSITMVFDPQEPYFYLSSESMFNFKDNMQQAMDWADQVNNDRNNEGTDDNSSSDELLDKIPLPELNQLAWSSEGGIPLQLNTRWGLPNEIDEIKGHLFIDASMPLYKFFELDGEIVTSIGKDGYTQLGNGHVSVNFDLIPNFLNFSFDLGQASAGVVISGEEQSGFFSGIKKADTSFLPSWVPIQPISSTQIAGYISSQYPHLSRLSAKGEFGFSTQFLSDLIGVTLNDIVLSQTQMSIDANGIKVIGKTNSSIHPAIQLGGSSNIEIYFPFANAADTSIKISGKMLVLGNGISPATLKISKQGFYIDGKFTTPLAVIALTGEISSAGPALQGMTQIILPLDKITDKLNNAQYAVAVARDKVNEIQRLIDVEKTGVIERRAKHAEKLKKAQNALSSAQNKVKKLQSSIDYQYGRISSYRKQIKSKYKGYKNQHWTKKTWAWGVYKAYKVYKYGKIGVAYTAIGALKTSKTVAIVALKVAKYALQLLEAATEIIPVELDPKVSTLIVSKEGANLVLFSAEEILKRIPTIDFNAGTEVLISLDKSGVHGEVSLVINEKSFVGGSVTVNPVPKACIELPVMGEVCTPF